MKKFILFSIAIICVLTAAFAVGVPHIESLASLFNPAATTGGLSFAMAFAMFTTDRSRERAVQTRVTQICNQVASGESMKNGFIISSAYIRSEIVITNNQTTYDFEVRDLALQALGRPLVRGVLDNDLAFAYDIGLFIDNRAATANTDVFPQTYPNNTVFTASGATPSHLQAFYNGELTMQVGSTVFMQNYPTLNFNKVPVTQQSGATNQSSGNIDDMLVKFDPYVIISGRADNKVVVNIKNFTGFAAAATTGVNVLTFYAKVMTARNGANYIDRFMDVIQKGQNGLVAQPR